jgi:hypothetical protein
MGAPSIRPLIAAIIATLTIAATHAGQPAALKPSAPIRPGVAAYPRLIASTGGTAAARINAALQKADRTAVEGMCRDYRRRVGVTMRGPRYLGVFASDSWLCGGAHPDDSTRALVFDLTTGAPVDWKAILAGVPVEKAAPESGGGDAAPVVVMSAALWALYAKRAAQPGDNDCAEVLAGPDAPGKTLLVWPDAQADGLDLQAWDWPHVVKACAASVTIPVAELRRLGARADFLDAIDEAHRRGWYDRSLR